MNTFGELIGAGFANLSHAKYNDPDDNNVIWFKKCVRLFCLLLGCLFLYPFALPKIANNVLRMLYF